jgi:hypothetical protein
MRRELANYEWAAIKPFLPNKPRGVPRVNDRRVLNGSAVARSAGELWPLHHLLQSLCSMAQGWRVGSAYECVDRGLSCGRVPALQSISKRPSRSRADYDASYDFCQKR